MAAYANVCVTLKLAQHSLTRQNSFLPSEISSDQHHIKL